MMTALGYDYAGPGTPGNQAGGFIDPSQSEIAAQEAQVQPGQGQPNLMGIETQLAQIEGKTDKYYDIYGKLKSYVTEMNRMGIDVTKPDFTQPGGGEAFKTYKAFEAGLLNTANELKDENRRRTMLEPLVAKGDVKYVEGFDPRSQMTTEQDYYATELDPRTKAALESAAKPVYTDTDLKRKQEYLDGERKNLLKKIENTTDRNERERLMREHDQIFDALRQTDLPSIRPRGTGATKPDSSKILKEPMAIAMGGAENYEVEYNPETGDPMLVLRAYNGMRFGKETFDEKGRSVTKDRIVDYFEIKDNGEVYAIFQRDEYTPKDKLLSQRVDNLPPATLAGLIGPNLGTAENAKLARDLANLGDAISNAPSLLGDEFEGIAGVADKNKAKIAAEAKENAELNRTIKEAIKSKKQLIIAGRTVTIFQGKPGRLWGYNESEDGDYYFEDIAGNKGPAMTKAELKAILREQQSAESNERDW